MNKLERKLDEIVPGWRDPEPEIVRIKRWCSENQKNESDLLAATGLTIDRAREMGKEKYLAAVCAALNI